MGVCHSTSGLSGLITLDAGLSWKRPTVTTTPSTLKGGWSDFRLMLPSREEGRFHSLVVSDKTTLWFKGEILGE
jgi:hypothetical protein